jgi:hypothetical protein
MFFDLNQVIKTRFGVFTLMNILMIFQVKALCGLIRGSRRFDSF